MLKLYKNLKAQDWVLVVLIVGITVAQVYFTMELTDKIADIVSAIRQVSMHVPGATTGDIWREGGLMLAFAVCSALCQVASGIAASRVASGLSATLRSKVYAKVESFSVAEINKFSTSSLITRTTNDIQQVQLANILVLRMLIYAPIMAIWAICKINASSWQLTTATAVAVVVLVVCIIAIMLTVMPKFRMMQKLTDRLNGVTRENLTGIKVVRAYNAENYQEKKFEKAGEKIRKSQRRFYEDAALYGQGDGADESRDDADDERADACDLLDRRNAHEPRRDRIRDDPLLHDARLSGHYGVPDAAHDVHSPAPCGMAAKRVNEVLHMPISISDPETELPATEEGTVEFRDVSFRYPDAIADVFSHISFRAEKGQTVAFIGSTGSGKSTLINLVPRFYDATEGEVLVDGVNVKDMKQNTLRGKIGYVPQKGVLFTGTVAENIAFGGKADRYGVVQAAKIAEGTHSSERWNAATTAPSPRAAKTFRAGRNSGSPLRAPWRRNPRS